MPQEAVVQMRLFDITGKTWQTWYDGRMLAAGNHQLKINRENLAEGIYFIQLQTKDKSITQKWGVIK